MAYRIIIILLFVHTLTFAQTLNFSYPAQVCLTENIKIENTSDTDFNNFQWDFCEGDLFEPVQSFSSYLFNEIDQAADIKVVEDNGFYFGFVVDRSTNSLFRFHFGLSLNNAPSIQKVNLPSGLALTSPQAVALIKVSNNWFGFIASTGNNKLFRLDFGLSLQNDPTSAEINFQTYLNAPVEVEIAREGNNYFLLALNFGFNNVVSANLGALITNTEPLSFQVTPVAGSSNPYGLSIQKYEDGTWRGVIGSYSNNSFHSLEFASGLNAPAVVSNITSTLPAIINPVKLALAHWGKENVLLIVAYSGEVHRIRFKRNMLFNAVESSDILNASYGPTLPLTVFYEKGNWKAFTFPITSRTLKVINFNKTCGQVNIPYYQGVNPPVINFSISSTSDITLRGESAGVTESNTKEIVVKSEVAPASSVISEGVCLTAALVFQSQSNQVIQLYQWSFGDSQTSTDPNPTHQYSATGDYTVSLQITADNGCNNYVEKNVKIYNPPVSLFDSPTGLICTNNQFTFINNTVDNFDGNLSYEWFVNDELKSTTRDFDYAFATTGDQQVKLKTSIPGCFSEQTQTLLGVQSGPVVGFSYTGKCEDENILFTNESSGSISGFEWSFGNGNTSTLQNPTQAYTEYGQYDVTLNTTGTNGCVSSLTKKLNIYSVPQTDFMIELPPFSCAGTASQFRDLTPSMPDSNVSSWQWSFGDGNNGTATTKNPQYTYALASNYNVSLKTTTNFGCSNTTQKTITIQPSPKADFDFANACVKQSTIFTDKSTGDIKSWNWLIQNFTDTKQNTAFSFQSAGTYTAALKVTATNNCISQIAKNVLIPVAPQVDFSATSTCKDIATTLTGITSGGTDPVTNWMWDFGDGFSGDGATTTHVYTKDKIYSVVAKAVGQSGCVYPYTDEISIIKAPVAKFTVPLDAGPVPFNVPVTNLSTLATKYEWRSGIAGAQVDNSFSPSFIYSQLGDYTLELRASNDVGCVAVAQQKISVVIPQINASMVDFRLERIPGNTAWRPMAIIKNNSNVAITDPEIFLDISGGGLVSEKLFGLIKPNQTDTLLFNSNLGSRALDYVCAYLMVNADVNKYDDRECIDVAGQFISITPYPNPANEYVMLEWVSQIQEPLKVVIYNETGQSVLSRTYDSTREGLNQVKVEVSQLRAGIYFVTYELAGQSQHHRFSVVR